jgi:hypothetical protein
LGVTSRGYVWRSKREFFIVGNWRGRERERERRGRGDLEERERDVAVAVAVAVANERKTARL